MSDEFTVNDKRLFNKDGQVNHEAAAGDAPSGADQAAEKSKAASQQMPPANFAGLLVGLATSAFIHLGESPDPDAPKGKPDLLAAKHAIDLLAVLQNKTKGNLEQEEEALLQTLLYDLRLKYVKVCQN